MVGMLLDLDAELCGKRPSGWTLRKAWCLRSLMNVNIDKRFQSGVSVILDIGLYFW